MPDLELDIPIVGGADTGVEPTAGVKPVEMVNCWYQKANGVTKRRGLEALTTVEDTFNSYDTYDQTLDPGDADYVAWANDQPIALFQDNFSVRMRTEVYSKIYSEDRWYTTDMLPSVKVEQLTVGVTNLPDIPTSASFTGYGVHSCDFAGNDRYGIVLYSVSNTLMYSIVDFETFSLVIDRREVPLPTGGGPYTPGCVQCCRAGDDFVVAYCENATDNTIYVYRVDGDTFKIGSSPALTITDKSTNSLKFHAVNDRADEDNGFYILFTNTFPKVRVQSYDNLFIQTGFVNTATCQADTEVFADVSGGLFYLLLSNPTGSGGSTPFWYVQKWDNAGPLGTSTTYGLDRFLTNASLSVFGSRVLVSVQHQDAFAGLPYPELDVFTLIFDTSINVLSYRQVNSTQIVSGPLQLTDESGNFIYLQNLLTQSLEGANVKATEGISTFWIPKLDVENSNPRAVAFLGMGTTALFSAVSLPKSVAPSEGTGILLGMSEGNVIAYKFTLLTTGQNAKTLHLQNHNVAGDNFNLINFPGLPVLTGAATGGLGLEANTSYGFTCTLSYTDDQGRAVESAPAIPISVELGAGETGVDITILLPFMPVNPTDLRVRMYRTLGNQQAFYLADILDINSYDRTKAWATWADDEAISANPQLYTEGGALDHICPPAFICSAKHQNRLFLGGTPDDSIWYSNERIQGEAYNFSEGLTFQPFEGGRVVALQSLDSALVVFKSEDIFAIQGNGPDDTGAGGSYGLPTSIQSNTGCVEPESVVSCPLGVYFRGKRGIYLLDRSLQVKFVGRPIEAELTSDVTISDAIYWEKDNQVRFFSSAGVFVYDLINEAWSTFTYPVDLLKACVVGEDLYMVDSEQTLYRETGYLDNGAFIPMSFQTSFFRPVNNIAQGWQRFRRVSVRGRKSSSVDATVTLYRDANDGLSEDRSWTAQEIDDTYRFAQPQVQIHPTVQKLQSLSIKFEDATPTGGPDVGSGQGWTIQSIAVRVAPARGPGKIPAANNK